MFAVKILTILVVLQVINNSQSFPHGGLSALGTLIGWTNGLMSLASKQTRASIEETSEGQTDTIQPFNWQDPDETKRDNPRAERANCSTN